jgi:hypothetical protein
MTAWRHAGWVLSIVAGVIMGCVNPKAYQHQLPPDEHGRYRAYSRVMTPKQSRTYLNLPTAAERAAYAQALGVAELLETLPPNEREAVLQGLVFRGMSEQALRLLWGMPCWQDGPPGDEHWYYYGPSLSLTEVGRHCTPGDTMTEVSLEHGTVHWWKERVPSKGLEYRRRP